MVRPVGSVGWSADLTCCGICCGQARVIPGDGWSWRRARTFRCRAGSRRRRLAAARAGRRPFRTGATAARRVRDDGDVVFYNQRRSADGCLWLVDDRCVRVALDELADEVETVVVAAGLDDAWAGTFADDPGLRVRLGEAGESAWDGPTWTRQPGR